MCFYSAARGTHDLPLLVLVLGFLLLALGRKYILFAASFYCSRGVYYLKDCTLLSLFQRIEEHGIQLKRKIK